MKDLWLRVDDAIVHSLAQARRTSAAAALLRLIAGAAALAALVVALPVDLTFGRLAVRILPGLLLLAIGVGLFPRSRWVTFVLLVCVGEWVVAGVSFGDAASLVRIGLIGGGMYLTHATAAFAAVLPVDAVLAPGVLLRWARRQGLMLVAGLTVGLAGLAGATLIPATPTLVGPILGAGIAAALAGSLVYAARRRSSD